MMGYKDAYLNNKRHMAIRHKTILPSILENISKVLGDTVDGYSNSEIVYNLQLRSIDDPFAQQNMSKWKRIYITHLLIIKTLRVVITIFICL